MGMATFSSDDAGRAVHPPVERMVFVHAHELQVILHLEHYSSLFPRSRSTDEQMLVGTSGDWCAIRLPDAVHPWQLHNLAFWMLDCPGAGDRVIAASAAGPDHPGYRLVRDPEVPDALCGWDDQGGAWTVLVPTNDIARSGSVPVSLALTVPSGFHGWRKVTVRLEDPGAGMNPTNAVTVKNRSRLAARADVFSSAS
jgi:hypothetical protein